MNTIKQHINRYMFKYLSIAYLITATIFFAFAYNPLTWSITALLVIGSLVFLDFAMDQDQKRSKS